MTEDEKKDSYKQLLKRVEELRMQELFEEPSTYEDEEDE